jgi:hypothetical protein
LSLGLLLNNALIPEECEFDNYRLRGVARRATPLKRGFFVGASATHPNEKPLVELAL